MPYLTIRGLRKTYGKSVAVDGVDLSVEKGETLCLLGPSGCGKTTILRMIAGLIQPDAGEITVDGHDLVGVPIHKRDIGLVFQTWALFPHMTVADNVAYGLRMRRVPKREQADRVRETLELVRLDHLADRKPAQLSGGQQQRVALARALVTRPRLLLLDEPLSSLDLKIRSELRRELRRIQQAIGVTAIYVTHDHGEALALGDKVSVMSAGHVVESGAPELLFSSPRTRYVTDFLGFDNILPAEGSAVPTDDTATMSMALSDGTPVRAARGSSDAATDFVAIGVSPWAVTPGEPRSLGEGAMQGEVVALEHVSGRLAVSIAIPSIDAVLTGFATMGFVPRPGDLVDVAVDWTAARALTA